MGFFLFLVTTETYYQIFTATSNDLCLVFIDHYSCERQWAFLLVAKSVINISVPRPFSPSVLGIEQTGGILSV